MSIPFPFFSLFSPPNYSKQRRGGSPSDRCRTAGYFPPDPVALLVLFYSTALSDRAASLAFHLLRLCAMQASVRVA